MSLAVALPVRNGADYLAPALDSILAQDFADFTLHVSDNASTDATPQILADYAARDARVRVSRSEEPLSQVANMNRAVRLTGSEWVQMICHDDLMRGDCLAQIASAIAVAAGSDVALIGHAQRWLFASGLSSPPEPDRPAVVMPGKEQLRRRFQSGSGPSLPFPAITTAAVRRDAFEAVGGFPEGYLHFDLFCWMELLVRYDYAFVPAQLTVNRIHPAQVAVAANRSLRTMEEKRAFFPAFVERHGAELGLGRRARWVARGAALSLGAGEVVASLRTGAYREAAGIVAMLPKAWWPALPALVVRSWRADRKRQNRIDAKLSAAEFYGRG